MYGTIKRSHRIASSVAVSAILSVVCCIASIGQAQAAKTGKIDLELFKKSQVNRSRGCSVVLWQSNRNPDNDKYAYIFFEKLNADHVRRPARIKIGGKIVKLKRVATGGKKMGYDLYEFQLYKMHRRKGYVILDIKLEEFGGETVDVDAGTMRRRYGFKARLPGFHQRECGLRNGGGPGA